MRDRPVVTRSTGIFKEFTVVQNSQFQPRRGHWTFDFHRRVQISIIFNSLLAALDLETLTWRPPAFLNHSIFSKKIYLPGKQQRHFNQLWVREVVSRLVNVANLPNAPTEAFMTGNTRLTANMLHYHHETLGTGLLAAALRWAVGSIPHLCLETHLISF